MLVEALKPPPYRLCTCPWVFVLEGHLGLMLCPEQVRP